MDISGIDSEIRAAFRGVKLDGGVSLRQAEVMSNYGEGVTNAEFIALPQQEITDDWTAIPLSLLDNKFFSSHFDARGFRYYIPVHSRPYARCFVSLRNVDISSDKHFV